MDCYDIWVDLKNSHKDLEFARAVDAYMGHLKGQGHVESWRLKRRKFGFGPDGLGEFHLRIETKNLAQLEEAWKLAATRAGDVEKLHLAVYGSVTNFRAGLYRDFPDPMRKA